MNEPGTLSKTATASRVQRLLTLFGPGFSLCIEWKDFPLCWYEITAYKEGQYANWTMVEVDFDYTDEQLVEKFINPVKGVFK